MASQHPNQGNQGTPERNLGNPVFHQQYAEHMRALQPPQTFVAAPNPPAIFAPTMPPNLTAMSQLPPQRLPPQVFPPIYLPTETMRQSHLPGQPIPQQNPFAMAMQNQSQQLLHRQSHPLSQRQQVQFAPYHPQPNVPNPFVHTTFGHLVPLTAGSALGLQHSSTTSSHIQHGPNNQPAHLSEFARRVYRDMQEQSPRDFIYGTTGRLRASTATATSTSNPPISQNPSILQQQPQSHFFASQPRSGIFPSSPSIMPGARRRGHSRGANAAASPARNTNRGTPARDQIGGTGSPSMALGDLQSTIKTEDSPARGGSSMGRPGRRRLAGGSRSSPSNRGRNQRGGLQQRRTANGASQELQPSAANPPSNATELNGDSGSGLVASGGGRQAPHATTGRLEAASASLKEEIQSIVLPGGAIDSSARALTAAAGVLDAATANLEQPSRSQETMTGMNENSGDIPAETFDAISDSLEEPVQSRATNIGTNECSPQISSPGLLGTPAPTMKAETFDDPTTQVEQPVLSQATMTGMYADEGYISPHHPIVSAVPDPTATAETLDVVAAKLEPHTQSPVLSQIADPQVLQPLGALVLKEPESVPFMKVTKSRDCAVADKASSLAGDSPFEEQAQGRLVHNSHPLNTRLYWKKLEEASRLCPQLFGEISTTDHNPYGGFTMWPPAICFKFGPQHEKAISLIPYGGRPEQYLSKPDQPENALPDTRVWVDQIVNLRKNDDLWLPAPLIMLFQQFGDTPYGIELEFSDSMAVTLRRHRNVEFDNEEAKTLMEISMDRLRAALVDRKVPNSWEVYRSRFHMRHNWAPTVGRMRVLDLMFQIDLVYYFQGVGGWVLHPFSMYSR